MPSLRKIDKERLLKIIDFAEIELSDIEKYNHLTFLTYTEDREKRRSVERWIENIVNASLDIAKVILIAKDMEIPDTYKEYFMEIVAIGLITEDMAERLAEGVKIRNILAHHYIDIKWDNIKKFISDKYKIYSELLSISKQFI